MAVISHLVSHLFKEEFEDGNDSHQGIIPPMCSLQIKENI